MAFSEPWEAEVQALAMLVLGWPDVSGKTSYLELLSISVPVTLALATASWHFVEKKALRFKPSQRCGNAAL